MIVYAGRTKQSFSCRKEMKLLERIREAEEEALKRAEAAAQDAVDVRKYAKNVTYSISSLNRHWS